MSGLASGKGRALRHIDALVVSTPDHWHAIPTVLGCQAGKHIYVEKPDAHNRRDSRQF